VEVEGELRYREFLPADSSVKVRTAEIHVTSILILDRAEKLILTMPRQPSPPATKMFPSEDKPLGCPRSSWTPFFVPGSG
jgi:hypothetical protein